MNRIWRVLVADDHDLVRRGVRMVLEASPGFEVCGEARTGREAVLKTQELKPDVVVMDVSMPELNGLDATRQISKVAPQVRVVIISQHDSEELSRQAFSAGARAYILKKDSERELAGAVAAVCQQQSSFSQPRNQALKQLSPPEGVSRPSLTDREREVVQLLADGKSSKEVASILGISPKTAETHRANIMRKLNLHSISDLVRYAIRNKMAQA